MVSTNRFRNRRLSRNRAVVVRKPCACPTIVPTQNDVTTIVFDMEFNITTPSAATATLGDTRAALERHQDFLWGAIGVTQEAFPWEIVCIWNNAGNVDFDLFIDDGTGEAEAAFYSDAAGPPPTPWQNPINVWTPASGYTINSGFIDIFIPQPWAPFVP